jgi:hypothetical protein
MVPAINGWFHSVREAGSRVSKARRAGPPFGADTLRAGHTGGRKAQKEALLNPRTFSAINN